MQRADGQTLSTIRARPAANINNITNSTSQLLANSHLPSRLNQAHGHGHGLLGPVPADASPLRRLMPMPTGELHPDDDQDQILAVIFAILDRGGNRAMSVKELGEAAFNQSLMRTRSVFFPLFYCHFSTFFLARACR
jgi:hypothetical protein